MSIGTASSANTPTPSTKPTGTSATPEKYPFRNQRASSNPGASSRNKAAATVTPGSVARASRNGPTATSAAPPATATQASKGRKRALTSPTIPSDGNGGTGARRPPVGATSSRSVPLAPVYVGRHDPAQRAPGPVLRPHADVGLFGLHLDNGLEAVTGDGLHDLQLLGPRPGQDLPGCHLGGTIPARVERHLLALPIPDGDGGVVVGPAAPRQPEGPVRLPPRREGGVVEEPALLRELRVVGLAAPPDEDVTVRKHLHVALGVRDGHALRREVLAHQARRHSLLVYLQHHSPRAVLLVLRPVVVEEGDGAVRLAAGVVLEGEVRPLPHLEVAPLAPEPPYDIPRPAVYLVDGRRPAGGDEQVVLAVLLYGVYVEIVEAALGVVRGAVEGLPDVHVVEGVPLEEDLAALDVYLLDYAVQDEAVPESAVRGEVNLLLGVDRHQRGAPRGEVELVVVAGVAVAGPHPGDLLVGFVEDHVLALAVAAVHALPPRKDRPAPVALRLEVHGVGFARGGRVEPDGLAVIVHDHGPVLARPRLVRVLFGRKEDVAGVRPAPALQHAHDGRVQVGVRAEGPGLCRTAEGRGARPTEVGRAAARQARQRQPGGARGGGDEERASRGLLSQLPAPFRRSYTPDPKRHPGTIRQHRPDGSRSWQISRLRRDSGVKLARWRRPRAARRRARPAGRPGSRGSGPATGSASSSAAGVCPAAGPTPGASARGCASRWRSSAQRSPSSGGSSPPGGTSSPRTWRPSSRTPRPPAPRSPSPRRGPPSSASWTTPLSASSSASRRAP